MAENTDTLGEFQIRLETVGGEKVIGEIAKVRDALRQMESDAKSMLSDLRRDTANANALVQTTVKQGSKEAKEASVDTHPVEVIDNASKKQNRDKGSNEGDKTQKGIWELLKQWKNASTKERADILKTLSNRASALGGGAFGEGAIFEKFGGLLGGLSETFSIFAKLGPLLGGLSVALAGLQKGWQIFQADKAEGRHLWQELANLQKQERTFKLDGDSFQKLMRQMRFQNMVLDENGNLDARKTDQQAKSAALETMSGLGTDMAMYRMRGRVPQWMQAMWMQGEETASLEGIRDPAELYAALKDRVASMKDRLDNDSWLTFLAEANLPKEIMNSIGRLENPEDKAKAKVLEDVPTAFNEETSKKAEGAMLHQADNQILRFISDAIGARNSLTVSDSDLAKLLDKWGLTVEAAAEKLKSLVYDKTLGKNPNVSDMDRELAEYYHKHYGNQNSPEEDLYKKTDAANKTLANAAVAIAGGPVSCGAMIVQEAVEASVAKIKELMVEKAVINETAPLETKYVGPEFLQIDATALSAAAKELGEAGEAIIPQWQKVVLDLKAVSVPSKVEVGVGPLISTLESWKVYCEDFKKAQDEAVKDLESLNLEIKLDAPESIPLTTDALDEARKAWAEGQTSLVNEWDRVTKKFVGAVADLSKYKFPTIPTLPTTLPDGMRAVDGSIVLDSVDKSTEKVSSVVNKTQTVNFNGGINLTTTIQIEGTGKNAEEIKDEVSSEIQRLIPGLIKDEFNSAIIDSYNRVLEDSKYVSE